MENIGFRQFWLEDDAGERIGLNGEHEFFLHKPTGLGWTNGVQNANLKNGFFTSSTEDAAEQQSVVGDLIFHGDDPYTQYRFFADWVIKAKTLYLLYQPRTTLYRRRVVLDYLTKTEIAEYGALVVPIALKGMTPWYIPRQAITPIKSYHSAGGSAGGGFIIGTTTSSPQNASLLGSGILNDTEKIDMTLSAVITPNWQTKAALCIKAVGPMNNPSISIIGSESGTVYGNVTIPVTLNSNSYLEYSSEPGNCYVRSRFLNDRATTDLIDLIDLSAGNPYPLLPIDEDFTISITGISSVAGDADVIIQEYIKGV